MNNEVVIWTQMVSITQHYNIKRLEDEIDEQQHLQGTTIGVSQRQTYGQQVGCDV